jgi:dephospho-CoA kinase
MLRYGLTGGIASGKSTVAAMLRERGFAVIEADKISHGLIEPGGAAYDEVVARFGNNIVEGDRRISHSRLAAIVFHDREKLNQLNSILHPMVEKEIERQLVELESHGRHAVAIIEAALIFEAGLHAKLDGVIVAWCLPEQQLARLMGRGMSNVEAQRRVAAQMPAEKKLALATEKIDCSGSFDETRRQVDALAAKLRAAFPTQ